MKRLALFLAALSALVVSCKKDNVYELILSPESLAWTAEWIGGSSPEDRIWGFTVAPARYLRTEAEIDGKVAKATLNICGLGWYRAWINGEEITAGQLCAPTPSQFNKHVYFNAYDVTAALRKGENAFAVCLGNGRWTSARIKTPEVNVRNCAHFGLPQLLYQLDIEMEDGRSLSVLSDTTWRFSTDGAIRANNIYDGETFDANKAFGRAWTLPGYDDSSWGYAAPADAPEGELVGQFNPNQAVQDHVKPVSISKVDDYYVLDMGINMVGRLSIKASGLKQGDTLSLRFAERLNDDGSIYTANLRQARVTDRYIAKDGAAFSWHPEFVYHGFRYVEVKGLRKKPRISDFEGEVFYDKMASTGSFECSNPVINMVYANCYRGIRSNYAGMPTDCPQRDERHGWLGDRTMNCYGESYLFDNHLLYLKWIQDIEDCQNEAGRLPNIAPAYWSSSRDNMTWPAAFVTSSDMVYRRFGDKSVIVKHYPAMKKWMLYMKDRYSDNGIITQDRYGDWCVPPESLEMIHSQDPARITAGPVLSTTFYYWLAGKLEEFAPIAGYPEDSQLWAEERENTRKEYNARYFNEGGWYDNNTVTANLLSLYFGLVPEGREKDVFAQIVHKTEVECGGHVSCGLVGVMVLLRTLTEYGRPDLALKIASNTTYPSWGYMAEQGATTIWELWNGNTADPSMNSMNHVMMIGDFLIWDYEYLAGIRAAEPGYTKILLEPWPIEGLDWVKCSWQAPTGKIVSNWTVKEGVFDWDVEVPVKTEIHLPDGSSRDVDAGGHHFSVTL